MSSSTIRAVNNSYLQATKAYNEALKSSNKIAKASSSILELRDQVTIGQPQVSGGEAVKVAPAHQNLNILRQSDVIDVVSNGKVAPSFAGMLQDAATSKIKNLRKTEHYVEEAASGEKGLVEVMSFVNESEVVLQQVITVRDKLVNAFLEVLRMPL
ncbi:flagellar hook-basal body complex protein FliE [Alphaproteobacteria bacterium]